MPLPDLLGMLRYKSGVVTFHHVQHLPTVALYFTPGALKAFLLDGRSITSEIRILDILVAITASNEGTFQFDSLRAAEVRSHIHVPLDGMILSVVTNIDEILSNSHRLPSVDQVYSFIPGRSELQYDDPTLAEFLRLGRDQLEIGVSSDELAKVLHISEKQSQFYMLKLKEMGMIQPMRFDELSVDARLQIKTTEMRILNAHDKSVSPSTIYHHREDDDEPPQVGKITRLI